MREMLDGVVPPLLVVAGSLMLVGLRQPWRAKTGRPRILAYVVVMAGIVIVTALLELGMGRTLSYRNGPVRLWQADIHSDQNSQQVSDPYTFTHVIHGALFSGLSHLAMRTTPLGLQASAALALESAWEAYENTDTVINRYRAATIALGYYGDSVINSAVDTVACLFGFFVAKRSRWWFTVSWVAITEVALALVIRDNLTLNVIMLLYPIEAIKAWQTGA